MSDPKRVLSRLGSLEDEIERLRAIVAELRAALEHVRGIISEAAMTGFNWADGDWAERLFASQQITKAAVAKAKGE